MIVYNLIWKKKMVEIYLSGNLPNDRLFILDIDMDNYVSEKLSHRNPWSLKVHKHCYTNLILFDQ